MALELPPLTTYDVDLVVPATLQGNTAEERIRRRLTVTEPYVTRRSLEQLHELGVNPVLLSASSPDDDYFLLAFGCAFRPGPDGDSAPFKEANIGIRLDSPGIGRAPVALALSPDTASATSGNRSFRIALSLPLGVAEPSVEYAADSPREERYLTAYGLGSSNPEWSLREQPGHPLEGDVLLAVVVCVPAGVPVVAEVIVAASLRRLKVLRSRAELPPRLHTIDLSSHARRTLPGGPAGALPQETGQ
ncbi:MULTISPECIES: hypothetical protein [Streptomyces]|uniref:Uncharacterized protein n=4 Tax=Streptomyces TaxID=1883 RepID=A0ABW9IBS7_STRGJ|nr:MULTISPECIES: hypothetical protein [Streptomyces]MBP5861393.1 hypothetical protein [Streptomyces sp. LBUM 1484]MBP5869671.1 hypothetical protein [Streptomyces sp. LBUM 1485]MBP5908082.1 hypothetical protein [Streptomyces sp. LBUM 1478]MBP5928936.1 hypothetical protein [Streptomyces sp. LBUM 1479]KFG02889.1 hypothetical protein IQ61_43775 [Streptomyces scabiei]